jgi:sigma-E factor negative regulatory protein RseA
MTMDTNKKNREYISALADDEVAPGDQELALAALLTPEGRAAWETYHRIGDTLRAAASPDLSPGFAERLAARLAAEPLPVKHAAPGHVAENAAPATVNPE